jgi:hypothetical protein
VVGTAEQHEVVEGGFASVGPMHDVVGIAPGLWPAAAGEPARAISDHDGPSHACRHHGSASADVQGLGSPIRDHPGQARVAREASSDLRGDRTDIRELAATTQATFEALEIHRDHNMGTLAGDLGPVRPIEPASAQLR